MPLCLAQLRTMSARLAPWVLAALVGFAGAGAAARTLVWTASLDALTMDPHASNVSFTAAFVNNIYETLARYDDRLQIEPALAQSWEPVSPVVWRFRLRRDVRFHNGEPFGADDVVFSWQRAQTPGSLVKASLRDIKDVRKVDAHTVDVETRGAFPLVLNALMSLPVMSRAWCAANNAEAASDLQQKNENFANGRADGTGPFMLKSREVDARTVLAANPRWWDTPRHNLSEAVFVPIKADAAPRGPQG